MHFSASPLGPNIILTFVGMTEQRKVRAFFNGFSKAEALHICVWRYENTVPV